MELLLDERYEVKAPAPWHLWAAGGLASLWSLYCAARFLATQTGFAGGLAFSSPELTLYAAFPIWVSAFWALNVWGTVAGAALLLVRSQWAVQAFVVAIVGLIGVATYQFAISPVPADIYAMPIAFATWIIATASMLFACRANHAGLLR